MIPEQLKLCKFCRINKGEKRPIGFKWQDKLYSYEQIIPFIESGENYGILTGINQLGILDDDTADKRLMKLFYENFGKTFRVRGHLYCYLEGWDCNKIIFYDGKGEHMGELQGKGSQAVGAGSLHPSGERYELKDNIPILKISYADFEKVFGQFIKKKVGVVREHKPTSWTGDNITDIPIGNIISFVGLKDVGDGCYQGPHPYHSSTGGMNFRVDTHGNTWYCFRCSAGGGPSELIGVMEGIIDCSQAGPSCYTPEQARQVIQIAREKYGLKAPELQASLEPQGWALSINISKMAERNGLTNCPNCRGPLTFNDKVGFYNCSSCKLFGGLKKFAALIAAKEANQ